MAATFKSNGKTYSCNIHHMRRRRRRQCLQGLSQNFGLLAMCQMKFGRCWLFYRWNGGFGGQLPKICFYFDRIHVVCLGTCFRPSKCVPQTALVAVIKSVNKRPFTASNCDSTVSERGKPKQAGVSNIRNRIRQLVKIETISLDNSHVLTVSIARFVLSSRSSKARKEKAPEPLVTDP